MVGVGYELETLCGRILSMSTQSFITVSANNVLQRIVNSVYAAQSCGHTGCPCGVFRTIQQ